MSEKFTFFWNGPFSQWYPSKFKIDDVEYNCCEQWMMAEKARFFHDFESEKKIMETDSPKEQKALGRKVKGFDAEEWNKVARDIVFDGNEAKFCADENLQKVLLETRGTCLVEASPYDKVWGIGLAEDDPRALDRSQWQGTNWLGEVLDQVREMFEKLDDAGILFNVEGKQNFSFQNKSYVV